jgi:hypothetical protein
LLELLQKIDLLVINESEANPLDIGFSIYKLPEGTTAQEIHDKGLLNVLPEPDWDSLFDFVGQKLAPTLNGQEYDLEVTVTEAGQHGVFCSNVWVIGEAEDTDGDYVAMFTVSG